MATQKQDPPRVVNIYPLDDTDIENVIITALEGGSNYWYYLNDLKQVRKMVPREKEPCLAPAIWLAVKMGAEVKVWDCNEPLDDDPIGTLTLSSVKAGIKKAMKDKRRELLEFAMEDYDADSADVLFQYMVLGEIVYG